MASVCYVWFYMKYCVRWSFTSSDNEPEVVQEVWKKSQFGFVFVTYSSNICGDNLTPE